MNIPFFNLKRQYKSIEKVISAAFTNVMETGHFILGEELSNFEKEFSKYLGVKYCVGVNSGTDALHLSLAALGIKEDDEIITVPNTAIPTAMAITSTKAKPVFIDVKEDCLFNPDRLEEKISKHTKAIIPVHLYGKSCDMDAIINIANNYKIPIIEDACQAHGAVYNSKKVGTLGTLGCFSFYPTKNLGCYGDGGIIVCNDKELYEKLLCLRNCGQTNRYYAKIEGYNSRLDELQAAFLIVKLKLLDKWNLRRKEIAKMYHTLVNNPAITLPRYEESSVNHLFVIRTSHRDNLKEYLKQQGIGTEIHYPIPLHLQEAFSFLDYKKGDFPVTEKLMSEILSIPIFPELADEEVRYVSEKINKFNPNKCAE